MTSPIPAGKPTIRPLSGWKALSVAVRQVFLDAWRRPRSSYVGVATVVIVVTFLGVLSNAIQLSDVTFLRLAEGGASEADMLLLPQLTASESVLTNVTVEEDVIVPTTTNVTFGNTTVVQTFNQTVTTNRTEEQVLGGTTDFASFFLNHTYVKEQLQDQPLITGSAPRWTLFADLFNPDNFNQSSRVVMLAIDNDLEVEIGMGRSWTKRTLGEAEAYITSTVLDTLNVTAAAGERVLFNFDITTYLTEAGLINSADPEFIKDVAEAAGFDLSQDIPVNVSAVTDPLGIDLGPLAPETVNVTGEAVFDIIYPILLDAMNITQEFTVVDEVLFPDGKWPISLGNIMVVESKFLKKYFADSLDNAFKESGTFGVLRAGGVQVPDFEAALEPVDLNAFALQIQVMMADRINTYLLGGQDYKDAMIAFTNQVAEAIGLDFQASITLPVDVAFTPLQFIQLFLDQILNQVTWLLVALGALLIYTLQVSDVDVKTYEYGMLRALGMPQSVLLELILTQALVYALPGVVIAYTLVWLVSIPIGNIIGAFAVIPPIYGLSPGAISFGLTVGLSMPIVANIVPIQRALGKALRDSLDVYHVTNSEVKVKLVKLAELGLSPLQTVSALVLVAAGFCTYYVVPLSFIFGNFALFLTILSGVLFAMLFGMTLIASEINPFLERVVLWCIVWGSDVPLRGVVRKNLGAHRRRGRLVAVALTGAVAFCLFAGTMFTLQVDLISSTLRQVQGADLTVDAFDLLFPLEEAVFREVLDAEKQREGSALIDYSFESFALDDMPGVRENRVRMSTLGGWPRAHNSIYAVQRNFFDATFAEFYYPSELTEAFEDYPETRLGNTDPAKALYDRAGDNYLSFEDPSSPYVPPHILAETREDGTPEWYEFPDSAAAYRNYVDAVVSEGLRDSLSVDTDTPLRLRMESSEIGGLTALTLVKANAMLIKAPGYVSFTARPVADFAPAMVTEQSYMDLWASVRLNSSFFVGNTEVTAPPKGGLYLLLEEDHTERQRVELIDLLRTVVTSESQLVTDTIALTETTKIAGDLMTFFYQIVAAIAAMLSFFLLWLSFTANVRENSWEFGVLRSLGINAKAIVRVYIYEALTLVMSSTILGIFIGLGVASSLTLQFGLFTELPFVLNLPIALIVGVLAGSVLVAVFGSKFPAQAYVDSSIASVIKGSS